MKPLRTVYQSEPDLFKALGLFEMSMHMLPENFNMELVQFQVIPDVIPSFDTRGIKKIFHVIGIFEFPTREDAQTFDDFMRMQKIE